MVGRTLNSVAAQTYKNIEIIVVDDCSSDSVELQAILGGYDLDIKYIRHESNQHGGASRNTGIDASTGEYIAFWTPMTYGVKIKLSNVFVEE
ncbi:glycosyltransferase family 2 protein [Vibrio parahaemolyticus]|uniref:glycosyltransferase family 2 protein n=1 Tax=Vibrio parahaemolyticus TaxID=670 RepID=UPI00214B3E86|nr:glycosyltransferase family A protein [Vibrio parahaemolyticus]